MKKLMKKEQEVAWWHIFIKMNLREETIKKLEGSKERLEKALDKACSVHCKNFKVFDGEKYDNNVPKTAEELRLAIKFAGLVKPEIDLTPYIQAGSKYGELIL